MNLLEIQFLVNRITVSCLEKQFSILVRRDVKYGERIFLQVMYSAKCNKTGEPNIWKGRKYYLSSYMTDDEIIKTAYTAFKQTIEHEIMEGFKVDGKILFNPHVSYEALLSVSNSEVEPAH